MCKYLLEHKAEEQPFKFHPTPLLTSNLADTSKRLFAESGLYSLDDIGEINSQIGGMRRKLKLFCTEERRKWAQPMLSFIERNSSNLFLYKKLPEKMIEYTNNAAGIIFTLFKPQYKVMQEFQIPWGAQAHFNLFTLRHNFRGSEYSTFLKVIEHIFFAIVASEIIPRIPHQIRVTAEICREFCLQGC